jgi:hypothetical protein
MITFKEIQLNHRQKAIISSLIGVIVLIILIGIISLSAREDDPLNFLLPLKRMIYPLMVGTIWESSYFFTIPFSFLGIFLGIKSLESPRQELGFFAIVLNLINLFLALFIAGLFNL